MIAISAPCSFKYVSRYSQTARTTTLAEPNVDVLLKNMVWTAPCASSRCYRYIGGMLAHLSGSYQQLIFSTSAHLLLCSVQSHPPLAKCKPEFSHFGHEVIGILTPRPSTVLVLARCASAGIKYPVYTKINIKAIQTRMKILKD